jgi:hypothetical protein
MKILKLFKFISLFFICLVVLYLIFKELTFSFHGLKIYLENLNLIYVVVVIFFSAIAQVSNSYTLLLLYRTNIKIDFNRWNTYLYNSYVLDHIPFLGTVYRARKLKRKVNLNYNNFLSLFVFALLINFLLMSITLIFFLLITDFNIYNINLKLLNLIVALFFIFLFFIYNLSKFKFLLFNLSNNFIYQKLLNVFLNLFLIQQSILKNRLLILKLTFFLIITNLLHLFIFLSIFKVFNYTVDLNIQILVYLIFAISTLIKILPKNFVISEYIGASLMAKTVIGFAGGLVFFIFYRFVHLVCMLLLFFYFNINYYLTRKKFI